MTPKQILEVMRILTELDPDDIYNVTISPFATEGEMDDPEYEVSVSRATESATSDTGRFYGTNYQLQSEETVKP